MEGVEPSIPKAPAFEAELYATFQHKGTKLVTGVGVEPTISGV